MEKETLALLGFLTLQGCNSVNNGTLDLSRDNFSQEKKLTFEQIDQNSAKDAQLGEHIRKLLENKHCDSVTASGERVIGQNGSEIGFNIFLNCEKKPESPMPIKKSKARTRFVNI